MEAYATWLPERRFSRLLRGEWRSVGPLRLQKPRRREGALFAGALCVFPRHPWNIRAADADVGKLSVIEAGKLAQALVVVAPLPQEPDELSQKHFRNPLICGSICS